MDLYLLIRVGSLSTVLALAACGGTFTADEEKAPGRDAGCFPAITDCRDGSCKQGEVCAPIEDASAPEADSVVDTRHVIEASPGIGSGDASPAEDCSFQGALDVGPAEPVGLCGLPGMQGCTYVYTKTTEEVSVYSCPDTPPYCISFTNTQAIQGWICCPDAGHTCGPLGAS